MPESVDPRCAWLELHDPRRVRRVMQRAPLDLLVASTELPETIPANSIVGGSAVTAAYEADRKVGVARSSGAPTSELVELFRKSPLTGCTSIMDMALTSSGWNPLDPQVAGSYAGFLNYCSILSKTPFFTQPPPPPQQTIFDAGSDINAMVAQIVALIPGLSATDKERVTNTVVHMAHMVFAPGGANVSRSSMATLFVQHALAVGDIEIQVNLYFCKVRMIFQHSESKNSSSTTAQSRFEVDRVTTGFPLSIWAQYAEPVAQKQITLVDEWLKKTTSPT